MGFENKVAVVTGGRRGIGQAIACALAERGAHIVIADRLEGEGDAAAAQITSNCGQRTISIPTDVSDHQSAQRLIDLTIAEFGTRGHPGE